MTNDERELVEIAKKAIWQYMLYVCAHKGETKCESCQRRETCEKLAWQKTVDRIEKRRSK